MKTKIILAFLSVLFVFSSCQQKVDTDEVEFPRTITAEKSEVCISDCGYVEGMLLTDSLLWILREEDNGLLHVYDLSGNPKLSGIRIGQGGEDVLEVSSLRQIEGNVYLYDARGGTLSKILYSDSILKPERMRRELLLYDDAVMLSDDVELILPVNNANSYVLMNSQGTTTDSLSYFPPKPDGINDKTHYLACTGLLAYSPFDTTFIRSVAYDGGIDFFSVKNGKIYHTNRQALFDMQYATLGNDGLIPVPSDESQMGYTSLYSTPEHFYALFSGEKCLDDTQPLSKEIHVFNHLGIPQYKICFPNSISTFAVSADNRDIYVFEIDLETEAENVVKYTINFN